ncbi:D-ribose transporter subunit RbsB [uncultured Blautia sp.]|jgi:ribose transport system substrate-binding protein|nr:D-ribose transporter subunit RbsB [uncultured Blautia sp.]
MMKKLLTIGLCLIMILSLFGCSGGTTGSQDDSQDTSTDESQEKEEPKTSGLKIAYSIGYVGNAWRSQLVSSLEEAAEEYKADGTIAEFQVVSADNDSTTQISQCNAMLAEGLDALLICAVSPTTLASVVETAREMGTLVILSNDPAVYEGTYCVINDAVSYTSLINRWFATKVPGGSDIVYISGNPGNATDMLRDATVYEDIEKYEWNLLAEAPGKRNQAEAQTVMTTFLSAYDEIDGVLCQNTTFEGVAHAYENAGKQMPIVGGDSVMSTLRLWSTMGDYETIGVTNSPAISVASLHFAVLMLQGYELKEDALGENPLDPSLVNTVAVDPPIAITLDGTLPEDIMADYPLLTVLSRDEALEMYEGEEDTYIPDASISQEDALNTWFKT